MSGPIRFSWWKSLRVERRRSIARLLPVALLLAAVGLLISVRSSASQVSAYLVCARQVSEEYPLLYPPGTRLGRVAGGTVLLVDGFDLTSRPRLSYAADRVLFSARREGERYSQIWEMAVEGGTPRKVIPQASDCVTPEFLPDGSIVFSRLQPAPGRRQIGTLYVLAPDGDLSRISFGADLDLIERILEDGRILVRRLSSLHPDGIRLALRPDGTELERYLEEGPACSSTDEGVGPHGRIQPTVADSVGPISAPSGLEPGLQIVDSIRVAPRVPPPVSTSVVNRRMGYGWLLCLDARLSDLGGSLERAHRVRVVDATSGQTLGVEPLATDGSIYLKVPSDRLLRLEVLDDGGRVLARQTDGIWVRPNEHRGCVGCHEPRYLSPENRSPLALEQAPIEVAGAKAAPVKGRP
ncbi:MAG: hypothetical protein WAO20_14020 [Acidobacteriota bacterium]